MNVTRVVAAGTVVTLNCTLDANCVSRSFEWIHYSAFDTKPVKWYRKSRLSPQLNSSGVKVEDEIANGRSVLTIPRARLEDSGRFHCHVTSYHVARFSIHNCQMNFQLIVTSANSSTNHKCNK